MRIITPESKYWEVAASHGVGRDAVRRAVRVGARRALQQLPVVSQHLTIMISPDEPENTIAETGVGAITFTEEYVSIVFDYIVPYGAAQCLKYLRTTAGHEMVHAVSYFNVAGFTPAPLQAVVYEGLATVFEKQQGGLPLWGVYEDDTTMRSWLKELQALPVDRKNYEYLFAHPDGRKWVVYKTGTWLIEQLLANGWQFDELLLLPYQEVLRKFGELSDGFDLSERI